MNANIAYRSHKRILILSIFIFFIAFTSHLASGQKPDPEFTQYISRFPTPLLRAIALNDIPWLLSEIKNGGEINVTSGKKIEQTPLLLAISAQRLEIVRILINNKADVEITGENGVTPLILTLLFRGGDAIKIVEMLLAAGADVNRGDEHRSTVLMMAAANSNVDVLDLLLSKNPAINHANDVGITALMIAQNSRPIIERLLKAGANTEIRDVNGETAIFFAIRESHLEKLETLVKAGAKIDVVSKDGVKPKDLIMQVTDIDLRKQMLKIVEMKTADPAEQSSLGDRQLVRADE